MTAIEQDVVDKLKETKTVITTVESCTGGLLANLLTNVSDNDASLRHAYIVQRAFRGVAAAVPACCPAVASQRRLRVAAGSWRG